MPHFPYPGATVAFSESRAKTAPGQGAKVVQLQYVPRTEYLQPFLGEGFMTVREIVHCSDRAVRKRQGKRQVLICHPDLSFLSHPHSPHYIVIGGCATDWPHCYCFSLPYYHRSNDVLMFAMMRSCVDSSR